MAIEPLQHLAEHLIDHAALGVATTVSESRFNKNFLDVSTTLILASRFRIVACDFYELDAGAELELSSNAVLCVL